jgi:Lecithin retinol acyltransferase
MFGVIGMYMMTLTPGSVVKVWSRRYHFWHKGMVDWPDPLTGEQRVIHSEKGNFVRTTSLSEFAAGEMVHILWAPQTWEQQNSALQRMHSLDGKPYDLLIANCEHVVNWAVTGKSFSEQLAQGAVVAAGLTVVALVANARS